MNTRALEVIAEAIRRGGPIYDIPDPVEVLRDVLKALREPSLGMNNAAAMSPAQAREPTFRLAEDGGLHIDWWGCNPTGIWRAMIDAALSETIG